jgi:hypothetical protein
MIIILYKHSKHIKYNVFTSDCDDCSENLNAHYFTFAMTNKFGAKNNYVDSSYYKIHVNV